MRAAMYYANDDVRIVDLPKPKIGPGEILVKVRSSGICGSDVMEWYRKPKAPLVLGHEIAAEVAEVGAGVDQVKGGNRVFVSHHVPCGKCRYCLEGHETVCDTLRTTNFDPGGFAEFVRVPAINVKPGVFRLPPAISDDEAVFIEPLACVFRGQRHAGFRPGHTVLFFAPTEPTAKLELPFNTLWREEVTMVSSYGASPGDIRAAIDLLAARRVTVNELVTHVLPLSEAGKGFRLVSQASDSLKVVLRP